MIVTPQLVRIPSPEALVYKFVFQQITPGGPRNFDAFNSLTANIDLMTIPDDHAIAGVRIRNLVRFQGPSITSLTCSVGANNGATSDNTFYASPYELSLAVTDRSLQMSSAFQTYSAQAHYVYARFTSVGANLSALTAGSVEIAVRVVPLL